MLRREHAAAVIADDEFAPALDAVAGSLPRLTAWVDTPGGPHDSMADLVGAARAAPHVPSPGHESRHVILTSGTTGRPKGAAQAPPRSPAGLVGAVALLDAIPYRARRTTLPSQRPRLSCLGPRQPRMIGMLLQSTLVMQRRFNPEETCATSSRSAPGRHTLAAVPVMACRQNARRRCGRRRDVVADSCVVGLCAGARSCRAVHGPLR